MAEKRERKPLFTSPRGIATGYVYLNKPDTEGEYADDKYKVVMAFDAEDKKIQTTKLRIPANVNTHTG